jgi:hypothetical protein
MQELKEGRLRLKAWPVLGILIVESILFLGHWLIYFTVVYFFGRSLVANFGASSVPILRTVFFILAFSFIAAALLSYKLVHPLVSLFYRLAAVWLGFLNFFFFAAWLIWLVWLGVLLAAPHGVSTQVRQGIAAAFFGLAAAAGIYGLLNAWAIRTRRVTVSLAGLPDAWRGRTAMVASDLHLGHINGPGFARRIVRLAAQLQPDVVLLPGDIFDGTKIDPVRLTAPFKEFAPPFGTFFATGNHDEFGDTARYLSALRQAGVQVLANEKVVVDELQIAGVNYHETTMPMKLRTTLEELRIDRGTASILLNHVPNRLPLVEEAGFALQLSGHTHGGQFTPFTWLTRRIFGRFTYGLNAFGALQVLTSYGAGTWGPPMRVGTSPEVVLIRFE